MKISTMAISAFLVGGLQANSLDTILEQRLAGDSSGVCVAVVRIDAQNTDVAFYCADPQRPRTLGPDSRFEIGSVSKVFLGQLAAQLIERGELALEQPIAELLDAESPLPEYDGRPIRVIDLLTHTSGLPRLPHDFEIDDPDNPYADYTPEKLLSDLAGAELESKPGERYEYSNFGYMVLSLALVRHTGKSLAELLEHEIFRPLGMDQTSLAGETVQGHSWSGSRTGNWDFHPNLGGVGAIRSTPADMARWLEASLGRHDGPLNNAFARARQVLIEPDNQPQGYGWGYVTLGEHRVLAHDGGTGGFSSFAVVDPDNDRASLVLMDTSMVMRGSLSDLGLHLVDSSFELQAPRLATAAVTDLDLEPYVGRFALYDGDEPFMGDFVVEFSTDEDALLIQASAGGNVQPKFPMVAEGDDRFTIADLDLTIEFRRDDNDEVQRLDFAQGPLELQGKRL